MKTSCFRKQTSRARLCDSADTSVQHRQIGGDVGQGLPGAGGGGRERPKPGYKAAARPRVPPLELSFPLEPWFPGRGDSTAAHTPRGQGRRLQSWPQTPTPRSIAGRAPVPSSSGKSPRWRPFPLQSLSPRPSSATFSGPWAPRGSHSRAHVPPSQRTGSSLPSAVTFFPLPVLVAEEYLSTPLILLFCFILRVRKQTH